MLLLLRFTKLLLQGDGDISPANIQEGRVINASTYVELSGRIKTSVNYPVIGQILDCYV